MLQRFALSKVYYAARFTMPQHIMKMFENAIWSFVWQERQPLVKRGVCIALRDFEGLDVPHLPSRINAIQIQSLKRLFTANVYMDWMNYPFYWFRNIGGLYR